MDDDGSYYYSPQESDGEVKKKKYFSNSVFATLEVLTHWEQGDAT